MEEIINCLTEEANRCRGLAALAGTEPFKADYLHKAELLEQAAEIVRKVQAIQPHGDLIDRDELSKIVEEDYSEAGWWFESKIEEAPTIIPASEEAAK